MVRTSQPADVDLGILGPMYIEMHGTEIQIRSPKPRALLAALIVHRGTAVSFDHLVDIVWGSTPPRDPEQALHSQMSRLRRRLSGAGRDDIHDVLATRPSGYALAVDDRQVDAGRFEALAARAEAATVADQVLELAKQALSLWRGPALVEFDQAFARTEAARLDAVRVGLQAQRADALLAVGRAHDVVADLDPLVAEHVLDEHLHGRLMLALYRCGRQADALAVYRRLRDRLMSDLGLEPSAELRQLERDILQHSPELAGPRDEHATSDRRPFEDPAETADATDGLALQGVTSFVGRGKETAAVIAAMADARLVTLTGLGGVGKTRLALRVARELTDRFTDGVRICDLAAVEPAEVANALATTLRIQPGENEATLDAVVTRLSRIETLLLLDNCEHVVEPMSHLVNRIVRQCPHVRLLATSRQPLSCPGEQVWPVRPLAVDAPGAPGKGPAVDLFLDRAHAAAPEAIRVDDLDEIADLCRRLDGLPLAIELAAARIGSLGPGDLAARLDRRFELLTSGRKTDPRHQTLSAVIDFSYELLSPQARTLFDRLVVFAGGFTLVGAEHVCVDDELASTDVAIALSELVDQSLVVTERTGPHARYRLLETMRVYATSKLADTAAVWRTRHARHFADLAREAEAGLRDGEVTRWVTVLDTEFANLRAAFRWAVADADLTLALDLPITLHHYAYFRLRDEIFRWAEQALELPDAKTFPRYPMVLAVAASGAAHRGELDEAGVQAQHARQLAGGIDEGARLRAIEVLGDVAIFRRRLRELEDVGGQLVEQAQAARRPYDECFGHLYSAFADMFAGRTEAAAHVADGSRLAHKLGNADQRASFLFLDGQLHLDADPARAGPALEAAIHVADSVGNRFVGSIARVSQAALHARHGEAPAALKAFRDVIDLWRRTGLWTHQWATLRDLAQLFARLDANEEAAVLHGAIERAHTYDVAFGVDAERRESILRAKHSALSQQVLTTAANRGRTMDEDEAVAWALSTIDLLLEEHGRPS